jgi:hypothetical protein
MPALAGLDGVPSHPRNLLGFLDAFKAVAGGRAAPSTQFAPD